MSVAAIALLLGLGALGLLVLEMLCVALALWLLPGPESIDGEGER